MLIRSQDKKDMYVLENISRIGAEKIYGKDETDWVVELNHSNPIGTYSTEEKAIKVLDMICENYELSLYSDDAFDQSANVQRPYIFARNNVFQMPQESEVNS